MDGNVLFENNADAGGMNNHGDRPEIVQAFAEGEGNHHTYQHQNRQNKKRHPMM